MLLSVLYVHSDIVCSYCVIEAPKFSRLFDHYKLCSLVFRYRCLLKFVELQVTEIIHVHNYFRAENFQMCSLLLGNLLLFHERNIRMSLICLKSEVETFGTWRIREQCTAIGKILHEVGAPQTGNCIGCCNWNLHAKIQTYSQNTGASEAENQ